MAGLLQIRFTKTGVVGISRNELREVGRKAIGAPAELWWERYLRLHFMNTAYFRYNYKPRDPAYRKAKASGRARAADGTPSAGEDKPLVFSGRSREQATSVQNITAKAPSFRRAYADVVMNTPALNYIPRLNDELTRVIPQETRQMERVFGIAYEAELNKRGRTRSKTTTYKAAA